MNMRDVYKKGSMPADLTQKHKRQLIVLRSFTVLLNKYLGV